MEQGSQELQERSATRDGLAAVAAGLLTIALIVFLVSRII